MSDSEWLAWAKRLRAIAQTGREYSRDGYDLERYDELRDISEAMLARLMDEEPGRIAELFLPEKGYPTPKVDLRAGVFESDRVLLVRETSDGRWSLPGGWADEHDSPKQGIEREVLEESGYVVDAVKLVAIKDRHLHPYTPQRLERIYKLFFLCEVRGGAPQVSIETSEVGWFAVDDLPELSIGRTLGADVEHLFSHQKQRSLPVTFD